LFVYLACHLAACRLAERFDEHTLGGNSRTRGIQKGRNGGRLSRNIAPAKIIHCNYMEML